MKERINTLNSTTSDIKEYTVERLESRGVRLIDISNVAWNYLSKNKNIEVDLYECTRVVSELLNKREILHKVILGLDIDEIVEKKIWSSPLVDIIQGDDGLFGVDELFGINIASLYGAIGYEAFGYFDKVKPGVINKLDTSEVQVNTFLDDIVCGLAAAAASKIIHTKIENDSTIELKNFIIDKLKAKNISISDIAQVVYSEQKKYNKGLELNLCIESVEHILSKREVLNKIAMCLFIDNFNDNPIDLNVVKSNMLYNAISTENSSFGINKLLGLSISELYGAIGYSNFGYFCETKPGVIGIVNTMSDNEFLSDILCGIISAASGKIAHYYRGHKF